MDVSVKYEDLRQHYISNFEKMEINSDKVNVVNDICDKIISYDNIYKKITDRINPLIPNWLIGLIHYRESSFSFNSHLHNGDSLKYRTKNVPSGRPLFGNPPFAFEDSASDALFIKGFAEERSFHLLSRILWILEKYNGFGYLKYHSNVLSPYLWSFTNLYTCGGYASDGKFTAKFVSQQAGCSALIKILLERKVAFFDDFSYHIKPISNPVDGQIDLSNVVDNIGK